MEREIQEYYENYFEMFSTKGWKVFIEDVTEVLESLKDKALFGTKSIEELFYLKGQADYMSRLINLEPALRTGYDNILYQEENKDVDYV